MNKPRFFEFFAGGGMARAGLGDDWECAFANDFDPRKAKAYAENWGDEHLVVADINDLSVGDLPGYADLVWASFPCQDLSLAGNAAGLGSELAQTRSGAFWALWRLILQLQGLGSAPALIVLENVYGALTANGGRDFALIGRSMALAGYTFGALLIDAVDFVPQSRPRLFIVGIRDDLDVPENLLMETPDSHWHPAAMIAAIDRLAEVDYNQWRWLCPTRSAPKTRTLAELIETSPSDVAWHDAAATQRLIDMMSDTSLARLDRMRRSPGRSVGTIYKRTRFDAVGRKVQRAELRNDQIAGCLRTPGGGSSRQLVLITEEGEVRSRLLSTREAARLMGLPDTYKLPNRYNDAYHLAGDGVVVPVVRYLADSVLEPILNEQRAASSYSIAAE